MKTVTVSIGGMHCAMCARSLESLASSVPGIGSVEVSVTSNTATFSYYPDVVDGAAITEAVSGLGYSVEDASIVYGVTGMHCAMCARSIEGSVGSLPGVRLVSVNLPANKVYVSYNPLEADEDVIKGAIRDAGFGIAATERREGAAERTPLLRTFLFTLVLSIPIIVLTHFVAFEAKPYVLFALTTPVQLSRVIRFTGVRTTRSGTARPPWTSLSCSGPPPHTSTRWAPRSCTRGRSSTRPRR
jgi:Cu+-exporting ATPase